MSKRSIVQLKPIINLILFFGCIGDDEAQLNPTSFKHKLYINLKIYQKDIYNV